VEVSLSLKVPSALVAQAQDGDISDADFVACIRDSLPYAWSVVSELAETLTREGGPFADNQTAPPDEEARGQLLRMAGSDAMRGAIERHLGVKLAFQNCHRLALFNPTATDSYAEFISPRAQVLNQKPELVNC
jgi:NucS shadow ORF